MSWPAVHWAFAQRAPSSAAKFLLIVLADNAAVDDWRSWPSIPYLVETTQQDRKTVMKNLRALESAALITPVGKTGRTGQVTVWRLPVVTATTRPKRAKNGPVTGGETGPDFPANSTKFPGKEAQKRDTEPEREPVKEPERPRAPRVAPSAGSDRGHRLPVDWRPSDVDLAYCREHRPELDPLAVAESFRDHWHAESGQRAAKRDWSAAWRTWVRRERASCIHPQRQAALPADDLFTGN